MSIGAKTLAAAALCASWPVVRANGFAHERALHGRYGRWRSANGGKKARNITLRHGEIRNVQMPAMTMVFGVKDSALLDKVKAGDKVKFKVEAIGGTPTVTVIEVVK